jgi:hypothetical protein
MVHPFRRRLVALSLLLAACAAADVARADAPPTPLAQSLTGGAKEDYDAARILYNAKDFAGASVKFASSYARSHDARLLYNMAACEKNLKHYARALELLRRYESEGQAILTRQDVAETDRLVDTFRSFVGTVELTSNEAGAAVTVDDRDVGATPLATGLLLDLGEHKIRVEKAGFVPFESRVSISGPAVIPLVVTLAHEVHEGVVTIHAGSSDVIALDGKVVATGDWTAHVASGAHTLTVTAEGMRTYQSDLLVEDDKSRTIQVALEPLPRRGVPVWILVTGGVVLATGAAVAAAAVYRSYSPLQQKPTPGTATPGYTETAIRFR